MSTDAGFRAEYGKDEPAKFTLGPDEVVDWDRSGKRQNEDGAAKGLTLNRIEDGNFDPKRPNDFYFVTTEGAPGTVPSDPSITRDGGGLFKPGAPGFITQDEESSGIIDARKLLGNGWFLFDAQVHAASPNPSSVELGQLMTLHVRNFRDVYDSDG